MKLVLLVSVVLFLSLGSQAQVSIVEDVAIDQARQRYAEAQNAVGEVSGWGILITANQDRRVIDRVFAQFKARYPEYRNYSEWMFDDPYYKVIVGAFPDRISALPFLAKIRKRYANALEVKRNVLVSDILDFRRISL